MMALADDLIKGTCERIRFDVCLCSRGMASGNGCSINQDSAFIRNDQGCQVTLRRLAADSEIEDISGFQFRIFTIILAITDRSCRAIIQDLCYDASQHALGLIHLIFPAD